MLCSFAIAQPLLDVTGRSPETFVFYRVDGLKLIAFVLLIVVVPPVVLWLAVTGISLLSAAAGRVAYVAVAGVLIALTVLQAGEEGVRPAWPGAGRRSRSSSRLACCGWSRAARRRRRS